MGLTKQHLAFHPVGNFNIVASPESNISFVTYDKTDGRYVAVGAAENVYIWDLRYGLAGQYTFGLVWDTNSLIICAFLNRLGDKVLELSRGKEEVTALRPSPDKIHLAVGYSDGAVRIFNLAPSIVSDDATFVVHRSAVNVLRYDSLGKLINAVKYHNFGLYFAA